jgi:hypothetical protein
LKAGQACSSFSENNSGGPAELHRPAPKSARYAQVMNNSVSFKETASERLFVMKDPATVEAAAGAKIYEGEISL